MIPMIGLMIWAYAVARLIEIGERKGDRKPSSTVIAVMIVAMLVMSFSCCGLMLSGKGVTP